MMRLKKNGQLLDEQKLEEITQEASHKGGIELGLWVLKPIASKKHLQARGSNLSVSLAGGDAQDDGAVMCG